MPVGRFQPLQECTRCEVGWVGDQVAEWDTRWDTAPTTSVLMRCWVCISTDHVRHLGWSMRHVPV